MWPFVVSWEGYTYEYFYKRFGRSGLDNANKRILNMTHLVNRSDFRAASPGVFGTFFVNASYAGDGVMVYGEGLLSNIYLSRTGTFVN